MWSSERGRACAVGVAVLAIVTSTPRAARAQATPPAPAMAAPVTASPPAPPSRPRRAAVWGGASLFALSYVAAAFSATTGYQADDGTSSSRAAMWVPLVGPFVTLGSTSSAAGDALLVLDGLVQSVGLTLFVYGLASSAPTASPRDASGHLRLVIAPLVERSATGAGVVGTF